MADIKVANRCAELSTDTGTSNLTLSGAMVGNRGFTDAFGTGTTDIYYGIIQNGSGEWEIGLGRYLGGSHAIARDTVIASSAAGALVNFPAGDKVVYSTFPANASLDLKALRPGDPALVLRSAAGQTSPQLRIVGTDGIDAVYMGPAGRITLAGAAPEFRFNENDQTDPAGRYRIAASGNQFRLQKALTAGFASFGSFFTYDFPTDAITAAAAAIALTGAVAVTGTASISGATTLASDLIANGAIRTTTTELSVTSRIGTSQPIMIRSNGNAVLYFRTAADVDKGAIYSDSSGNVITRNLDSSSRVIVYADGRLGLQGNITGIGFGSVTGSSRTDFSNHISLFGSTYGIGISSNSFNIGYPSSAVVYFVGSGTIDARVDSVGISVPSSQTIITAEKGDNRYPRLATDNQYAGMQTIANDGTSGFRIMNAAATTERGRLYASGTSTVLRNQGNTGSTTCQVLLQADGQFNLTVGNYAGNGSGLTNLSAAEVGIAVSDIADGGVGDRGTMRMSARDTGITKFTNYAGSALRWGGIAAADANWDALMEGSGNTAPSGTWRSKSQISATSGNHYCVGEFVRVA